MLRIINKMMIHSRNDPCHKTHSVETPYPANNKNTREKRKSLKNTYDQHPQTSLINQTNPTTTSQSHNQAMAQTQTHKAMILTHNN